MRERRRCQRINTPTRLQARVHSGESARVLDISPHGALVETEVALRPGAVCDVALAFEASGLHVRGMIRRCRAAPNAQGNRLVFRSGMEFLTPTPAQRQPLEELVAELCLSASEITHILRDRPA